MQDSRQQFGDDLRAGRGRRGNDGDDGGSSGRCETEGEGSEKGGVVLGLPMLTLHPLPDTARGKFCMCMWLALKLRKISA